MEKEISNFTEVSFTDDYIKDIKNILRQARWQSYKSVNSIMIQAYWLIGYRIVEQEQKGEKRAGYGEKLIETLSKELNSEIGSGMSVAHLKNCRQFYCTFPDFPKSYTLCSELSWSHLRLIMRLETEAESTKPFCRRNRSFAQNWKEPQISRRKIRRKMEHRKKHKMNTWKKRGANEWKK